jgi:hypothetical protein
MAKQIDKSALHEEVDKMRYVLSDDESLAFHTLIEKMSDAGYVELGDHFVRVDVEQIVGMHERLMN